MRFDDITKAMPMDTHISQPPAGHLRKADSHQGVVFERQDVYKPQLINLSGRPVHH